MVAKGNRRVFHGAIAGLLLRLQSVSKMTSTAELFKFKVKLWVSFESEPDGKYYK